MRKSVQIQLNRHTLFVQDVGKIYEKKRVSCHLLGLFALKCRENLQSCQRLAVFVK